MIKALLTPHGSQFSAMSPEMNIFRLMRLLLFIYFSCALTDVQGKFDEDFSEQKPFWDNHFKKEKNRTDLVSLPYKRIAQLYSRNSGKHLRIHEDRSVDAYGEDNNKNAKLIIESDRFGSVRIRGAATNLYLCMDRRGRLRGRERGIGRNNCVFHEDFATNAYTEFRSAKYPNRYLAFSRKGAARVNITRTGLTRKAVQFVIRPPRVRLYKSNRFNRFNSKQHQRITVSVKKWKEFKKWLKWRKQQTENLLERREEKTTANTRTASSTSRPHSAHWTKTFRDDSVKSEEENSRMHQSSIRKP